MYIQHNKTLFFNTIGIHIAIIYEKNCFWKANLSKIQDVEFHSIKDPQ